MAWVYRSGDYFGIYEVKRIRMGIVMTEQDINAISGKTREDYRKAKRELAALQASAAELAELAAQLKNALENPSKIVFSDGAQITGHAWIVLTEALFEKLSADNVRQLADNIKAVEKTKNILRNRIFEFDGEYPDEGQNEVSRPRSVRVGRMSGRR